MVLAASSARIPRDPTRNFEAADTHPLKARGRLVARKADADVAIVGWSLRLDGGLHRRGALQPSRRSEGHRRLSRRGERRVVFGLPSSRLEASSELLVARPLSAELLQPGCGARDGLHGRPVRRVCRRRRKGRRIAADGAARGLWKRRLGGRSLRAMPVRVRPAAAAVQQRLPNRRLGQLHGLRPRVRAPV